MKRKARAATLAVGTEITDGQIVDRNSAWISKKLTDAGVDVIEHRSVADDRAEIERALRELASRVEVMFVTGGLGPTSDDFTREILAKFCGRELEFDEGSWAHIEQRFASRGLQAKPIQRQQCFYPKGSRVLKNNAGTANAFSFEHREGTHSVRVYAMPGPPIEIATVWEEHLVDEIEKLTPSEFRDELVLIRTLGAGESAIAEMVEPLIAGRDLRVGYRAHVPYVEVKLWYRTSTSLQVRSVLESVERVLAPHVVGHGSEDLVDLILDAVVAGRKVTIRDQATKGLLEERILERLRAKKLTEIAGRGRLSVATTLLGASTADGVGDEDVAIRIDERTESKSWGLSVKKTGGIVHELEVKPTPLYNFGTERGRRYLCEAVFQKLALLGL